MRRFLWYSAVLFIASVLAALASFGIIFLFIPGFESVAWLPPLTVALSVPIGATLLVLERRFWP